MALGGGTFTAQNKVLPGTYVNVISRNSIKNNTESGVVAMPICLDWGPDDKIFEVTADEFEKSSSNSGPIKFEPLLKYTHACNFLVFLSSMNTTYLIFGLPLISGQSLAKI